MNVLENSENPMHFDQVYLSTHRMVEAMKFGYGYVGIFSPFLCRISY